MPVSNRALVAPQAVRLVALIVIIGAVLIPSTSVAQRVNLDSLRAAHRAEVDQTVQRVSAAVAIFLDRTQPESRRLAAVQEVTAILDAAQLRQGAQVVLSGQEPVAVRIRALQLAASAVQNNAEFGMQVVRLAESEGTPMALRREAMQTIAVMLWSSQAKNAHMGDIMNALRNIVRDRDAEMRSAALELLAAHGDERTLELLTAGLRNPGSALVRPAEAVRLIGLSDPTPHFGVLHTVLMQPPDAETRLEAARLLGAHRPSQPQLVRILQNPNEPVALRHAALGALAANDARNFAANVLPVVEDENAPRELRLNAIKAVELNRTSRDSRMIAGRQLDAFDRAVERLSEQSTDAVLRMAARNYVVRTRSAR